VNDVMDACVDVYITIPTHLLTAKIKDEPFFSPLPTCF
jgi:hypothetical protein